MDVINLTNVKRPIDLNFRWFIKLALKSMRYFYLKKIDNKIFINFIPIDLIDLRF